jgi:hypothetical protein
MSVVEFHTRPEHIDQIPHPYPASEQLPEWLKEMPTDWDKGGTIKRCPPFLAAMTAGYIIPAPSDSTLYMSEKGELTASGKDFNYLGLHFPEQTAGTPLGKARIVKFINPWVIVTPGEYVCFITAPLNRFQIPFTALSGIVETGEFYREINLPMACALQPGQRYRLLRGMPMIQVIPMRREEFASKVGTIDAAKHAQQDAMFEASPHFYKEHFWKKMSFS